MFAQLKEFGAAYIIVMVLVVIVFILDAISIIKCLTTKRDTLTDYAEFMVKYAKIFMLAIFGAYFILQTLDDKILTSVKVLHIIIGVLALIDAVASLIVKLKYRYARVNDKRVDPKEKDLM